MFTWYLPLGQMSQERLVVDLETRKFRQVPHPLFVVSATPLQPVVQYCVLEHGVHGRHTIPER
jgi:hypothetical protein